MGPIKIPISDPDNAETHEDLSFVFEQSDYQDFEEETADIKAVEPFFFHERVSSVDSQTMESLIEKVIINICTYLRSEMILLNMNNIR